MPSITRLGSKCQSFQNTCPKLRSDAMRHNFHLTKAPWEKPSEIGTTSFTIAQVRKLKHEAVHELCVHIAGVWTVPMYSSLFSWNYNIMDQIFLRYKILRTLLSIESTWMDFLSLKPALYLLQLSDRENAGGETEARMLTGLESPTPSSWMFPREGGENKAGLCFFLFLLFLKELKILCRRRKEFKDCNFFLLLHIFKCPGTFWAEREEWEDICDSLGPWQSSKTHGAAWPVLKYSLL